jgi:hypothetical protein
MEPKSNPFELLPDEIIQEIIYQINDIEEILTICSSDTRIEIYVMIIYGK